MFLDASTTFQGAAGLAQGVTAYFGFRISMRPVKEKRRLFYELGFVVIALVGIVCITLGAHFAPRQLSKQDIEAAVRGSLPILAASETTEATACRLEGGKLSGCTNDGIIKWGQPLLSRLRDAISKNTAAIIWRHQQLAAGKVPIYDKTTENARLNRYLESDYENLVAYRAALVEHLRGGDPTGDDPLKYLVMMGSISPDGRLGLRDKDSNLGIAKIILENLTELTNLLAMQNRE